VTCLLQLAVLQALLQINLPASSHSLFHARSDYYFEFWYILHVQLYSQQRLQCAQPALHACTALHAEVMCLCMLFC
jgi:hypothetical protein